MMTKRTKTEKLQDTRTAAGNSDARKQLAREMYDCLFRIFTEKNRRRRAALRDELAGIVEKLQVIGG